MMLAWLVTIALWCSLAIGLLLFGVLRENPENYLPWFIWPFSVLWVIEIIKLGLRIVLPYL